jgi:hypothetical protein
MSRISYAYIISINYVTTKIIILPYYLTRDKIFEMVLPAAVPGGEGSELSGGLECRRTG